MPIVPVELGGEPVLIRALNQASQESARLGRLPRNLPLTWAMAIPSRVRIRTGSASNSAKAARMLKNILVIGIMDISTQSQLHPLFVQLVGDMLGIWNRFRQAI